MGNRKCSTQETNDKLTLCLRLWCPHDLLQLKISPLDSLSLVDVLLKITSVDPMAISSQKTNKLIRSPLNTAPIAALT